MGSKVNKNSFVIQGSILAFAGILVRVIGLIYRVPLNRILGHDGVAYYTTAYDIYNVLILLSSQSMPLAVSKIVSEKLGKGEYKNAHRVFKGAMFYSLIIGIVLGSFAFFGADWLATKIYKTPQVALPLKVLAPTLAVTCILGVMRGYFQGMGKMFPTAVSQLFEQIMNAIVSVVAAYQLGSYGWSLAKAKQLSESASTSLKLSWAAAGGTLGTFLGAIIALLVVAYILFKSYGSIKNNIKSDKTTDVDSYSKITRVILYTITPVLISTTIYNISNLMDNPIFQQIMDTVNNVPEKMRSGLWGVYSGEYRLLTTMPIAIAGALSTAMVPSLVRSYAQKNINDVKNKIGLAIKFAMIIAFPCGMGLSVLGGPINLMLFNDSSEIGGIIMIFSIFTVVSFSLSTISNAILQGIDKLKVPIKNSAISIVIHLIILPILLIVFKLNIYAVVIGDFTFGITVSILNAYSIKKYTGYKQEVKNTFIKPFICSVFMGIGAIAVYKILYYIINSNTIATLASIIAAVLVYGISLIITKTVTEDELSSMPKGNLIIKLLKKLHLL